MKIMLIHRWGSIFHGFNLMMIVLMFVTIMRMMMMMMMVMMVMMMMMMMMMTDVLPHAGMDIDGRG